MTEERKAPPLPGLSGLWVAVKQLLGGDDASPVGLSAVYYPLVGLALGLAMVAVDRAATDLVAAPWPSVIVVLFCVIATRARPLLGLARTIGLSVAPRGRGDAAAIVVLLAVLLLALSIWVVAALDGGRAVALCFAPMLGRCAMVVIATGSRQARDDDRQVKFSRELTFREFGIASTFTFAVVFLTTHFLGLLLVLATGFLTIGLRLLVHWARGGVDRDSLHACGELVQLAALAIVAAF
jgi:cobalamin synthase